MKMTPERFNELVNTSLCHPMPMFTITRLMLCLRDVVESTGDAGAEAMERHCAFRDDQDHRNDAQPEPFDIGDLSGEPA